MCTVLEAGSGMWLEAICLPSADRVASAVHLSSHRGRQFALRDDVRASSHHGLPKRWRFLSSVAIAFFLPVGPAYADGWIEAEPALAYYDNLPRAQHAEDRRSDTAAALRASATHVEAFTGNDAATAGIDVRSEAYRRYPALDMLGLGAQVSYRHKFGLGSTVPWLLARVSYAREPIRDGDRLRIALEMGRRLSNALDVTLGLATEHRFGDFNPAPPLPGYSARVFDLRGRSAYACAGFAVSERLLLNAQLAVRRGDVESTAQQTFAIFVASDALAQDPAFRDASFSPIACMRRRTARS